MQQDSLIQTTCTDNNEICYTLIKYTVTIP